MATFNATGIDGLILSMQEIADLPDEVQDQMLEAQADVVVEAQKKKIRAYGIYDGRSTKHVANSIKKGKVKVKKGKRILYVSPTGSRKRGNTVTRNAEILFVNEFGKKGQMARPAVRDANEECATEATAAAFKVYDQFLTSKQL